MSIPCANFQFYCNEKTVDVRTYNMILTHLGVHRQPNKIKALVLSRQHAAQLLVPLDRESNSLCTPTSTWIADVVPEIGVDGDEC